MDFGGFECLPDVPGGQWLVYGILGDHLAPWHAWMVFPDAKIFSNVKNSSSIGIRRPQRPAGLDLVIRNVVTKTSIASFHFF